jgi:hypothetical protein
MVATHGHDTGGIVDDEQHVPDITAIIKICAKGCV